MTARTREESSTYVDTPRGIFTADGVWFRTTEKQLQEYAGPVLHHVSVQELVTEAGAWLQASRTLTLWVLPVLLFVLPPLPAALAALALYLAARLLLPGMVLRPLVHLVQHLQTVQVQAAYYVVTLSVLGMSGQTMAVVAGLAGFVLLRWGVLAYASRPVVDPLHRRLYGLPAPDQVLRALIVRVALHHDVDLPHLDELRRSFFDRYRS